jgi:hypothetical protein
MGLSSAWISGLEEREKARYIKGNPQIFSLCVSGFITFDQQSSFSSQRKKFRIEELKGTR